jgi:putative nucleotidyltransferase with HDIG domain
MPTSPPLNEALAKQIESLVLRRIAEDQLSMPSLPAIAIKCMDALKTTDFDFKDIASILERDPVLAARVLRASTSALFAGGGKTPSLTEALTRLGAKTVRTLLLDASAAKLFISRDAKIAAALQQVWQHSVAVGVLARDVSALTGGTDSESAYLAGLLHDIGKPVVAAILVEAEREIVELRNRAWISSAEWLAVLQRTHRQVGVALAEKWSLPPAICKCIKDCSEYDPSDRGAVSNAVCFSNALAKQVGWTADDSDIEDAKALVMIGRSLLGADDSLINPIVAALKPKVAELYKC